MRRTSEEERALFLSALSGRLPAKRSAAKPKQAAVKNAASKTVKPSAAIGHKPVLRGRRQATQEEMDLFLVAVTGHTPVQEQKTAKPKTAAATPPLKPTKPTVGLDGNTLRRLTRGELTPSAKLDLHGLTESAAHSALTAFVLSAHCRGDRLVLIVTGKGSSGRERGVLKKIVPRWLDEAPMAKIIAEKRWAHRRHGGDGALYVYLRKQVRK